jgi:hypothetical protein
VADEPCPVCGEHNSVRTQFCTFCGAYLGWDDEDEPTAPVLVDEPVRHRVRAERVVEDSPGDASHRDERAFGAPPGPGRTRRLPVPPHVRDQPDRPEDQRPSQGHRPPQGRQRDPQDSRSAEDPTQVLRPAGAPAGDYAVDPDTALRAEVKEAEVVVTPGAAPVAVTVRVVNASTIVQAYDVTVVNSPPWLLVTPGRVQLLPGTEEQVQMLLSIRAEDLVPVQRARLRLRVQGESAAELRRDARVDLIVGAVTAPPQLRLEPSTLRARDSTTALFRVVVDNRRSNEPLLVHLAGSDPELAAQFRFTPPRLEVPPGGAAAARMRVDAPLPEPGEQLTRTLTVVASDGRQEHEVRGTFLQASTPPVIDPPVSLRLDPSVVKVQNSSSGHTTVVIDNRRGSRPQQVAISADDDEGAVRFSLSPERLEVPAGRAAKARITMHAARPEAGTTYTRPLTVSAWNGVEVTEAQGSFVQSSSDRRPMARAALTALGSATIVLGSYQLWTTGLEGTGHDWSVIAFNNILQIPDGPFEDALREAQVHGLVDAIVTAGAVAILFAVLALFGLTGRTGRLTRAAAILCLLFLVAFMATVVLFTNAGIGIGAVIVAVGCVVAFSGGLLARR